MNRSYNIDSQLILIINRFFLRQVSFARIATPDRQPLRTALWRLRDSKSDARLLILTRWAPPNDFYDFVEDPARDIILMNQVKGYKLIKLGRLGPTN